MARILFAADFPPPWHGESMMVKNTVESDFAKKHGLVFVNTTPVKNIVEIDGTISAGKILRSFKAVLKVFRVLLRERVEIFYRTLSSTTNGFLRDFLVSIPALLFRKRIVLHAHCSCFGRFYSEQNFLIKLLIRFLLKRAELVIVPHEVHKKQFKGIIKAEKVRAVPNGTGDFNMGQKKFSLESPIILFLSNFFESKGFFVLLESAPAILKKFPNAKFVFAGAESPGFDMKKAEFFISEKGIGKSVVFTGPVSGKRKQELLMQADIFALPTYYWREAMPVTIIEAMAFGLPVVSTDKSAIPFMVENRVNGFIVPQKNTKKLEEAIIKLVSNKRLMEKMSRNNMKKYAENYTAEKFSSRLSKVFDSLQ